MNGKLDVFIYLMERGADINYENLVNSRFHPFTFSCPLIIIQLHMSLDRHWQTCESALSALSKFYVNNEKRFDDFAAKAAVKHELLEMVSDTNPWA